MKLTILGTGNAKVTECYNTCFALSEGNSHFLVDGGGGNGILRQLKRAGINWMDIKTIFVTHKHIDHVMGIIWMIRMIGQGMKEDRYEGEVDIFAHGELTKIIDDLARMLLNKKETAFLGSRIHLIPVADGEEKEILGRKIIFFDIQSSKAKQFGFTMYLNEKEKFTCCGDEPYKECEREYAEHSKWLLHEAFCLQSQADIFHPYEKSHSTVKDACELASALGVENLVLYHTEDKNIRNRRELYTAEGVEYFKGNLIVPEDLEEMIL